MQDHLPKSNNVQELGFVSPDGTLPYFFSARSLIFDLHCSVRQNDQFKDCYRLINMAIITLFQPKRWRPSSKLELYPIASIWGRENAVVMIKNRVQYTRGFTNSTFISAAFTWLATFANSTATTESHEADLNWHRLRYISAFSKEEKRVTESKYYLEFYLTRDMTRRDKLKKEICVCVYPNFQVRTYDRTFSKQSGHKVQLLLLLQKGDMLKPCIIKIQLAQSSK